MMTDILKSYLPVLSTLLGVSVGYLLSWYVRVQTEERLTKENFQNALDEYANGSCTKLRLLILHSRLSSRTRNHINIQDLIESHPDRINENICRILEKLNGKR